MIPRYPKVRRIPHPGGPRLEGKRYLGLEDLLALLNGTV